MFRDLVLPFTGNAVLLLRGRCVTLLKRCDCISLRGGSTMPERETLERAREDAAEGKSPSTQAGEFVREEIHHVREGKHGVRSSKQAIAIGLSKARRAGVRLPAPKGSASTRKKAAQDSRAAKSKPRKVSRNRSRAAEDALRREPRSGASRTALSRQAKKSAAARSSQGHKSAKKAARPGKAA
jgi:hypothetical protein